MRKVTANQNVMTTREVGETLGVAVRTVQLWVEAGILPAWRTAGGHRRIARSAVERLLADRHQDLAPVSSEQSFTKSPTKLLLIEDDPLVSRLFCSIVDSWGFPVEVTTAGNGFEGLMRIGEIRPDIVVTDLMQRGMDGFEMIRSLKRSNAGLGNCKLLVVSALSSEEIAERGGLPEDVVCFHKPVNFVKLEALIKKYFLDRTQKVNAV